MGIASLVLGIVAVVGSFIPEYGLLALIPALAGFGLGVADVAVKTKKGKRDLLGKSGLLVSGIGMVFVIGMTIMINPAPESQVPVDAVGDQPAATVIILEGDNGNMTPGTPAD